MNDNEIARKYGKNRSTVGRWRKEGKLATKLAELDVAEGVNVATKTNNVAEPKRWCTEECARRMKERFTPNWTKRYKSAEEARQTAVQMVLNAVPGAVMVYRGEVYG